LDLSALDILTPSEEGRELFLSHPRTGDPWRDAAGNPMSITLLGQHSGAVQGAYEALSARMASRPAGSPTRSRKEEIADEADVLTAATRRWTFETLDNAPFPCTPENARKFWSDPRFGWIRIRALQFIGNDGNFLAGPPST
jgi:hypothetical protein